MKFPVPWSCPGLLFNHFIMIYFIGVLVSLLIQWFKTRFGTTGWKTMLALALVSLLSAIVYTYFSYLGIWEVVAKVLMTAGAFYTFVLQRFESEK